MSGTAAVVVAATAAEAVACTAAAGALAATAAEAMAGTAAVALSSRSSPRSRISTSCSFPAAAAVSEPKPCGESA